MLVSDAEGSFRFKERRFSIADFVVDGFKPPLLATATDP
jgi:hypothetical protein